MSEIAMPRFGALDVVLATEQQLVERPLAGAEVRMKHGRYWVGPADNAVAVRWHAGVDLQVRQRTRRSHPDDPGTGMLPKELREERLREALAAPNTVARVSPGHGGRPALLYGLVDHRYFQPTDKQAVRRTFHQTLQRNAIPTDGPRFGRRAGAPTESYELPGGTGETTARVELKYGLDNGCSGYALRLNDIEVVVCSNGLTFTEERSTTLRWRHVRGEPVQEFLDRGLQSLVDWRGALESGMAIARGTKPRRDGATVAVGALSDSMPPEARRDLLAEVARRERHEQASHGRTLWATSQALSWVGTHVARGLEGWRLRRAATEVLLA